MATTIVAMQLAQDCSSVTWAHVGDSRLYLSRRQKLELLTADHTIAGSRYREGEDVPADLPHSSRLLQAVGSGEEVEVDPHTRALEANDVLLLCSDGVSSMMNSEAIAAALGSEKPLKDVGEELIRLALENGGKDNASAVLVRIAS
jgi:protein phosphatase